LRQTSGLSRPELESERERRLWPHAGHVVPFRVRHAPLLAAAICFAIGEGLTKLPPVQSRLTLLLVAAVCALAALTILSLRRAPRISIAAVLALWIADGLWSAQIAPQPPPQTALIAYADGLSRTVEGRIIRIRQLPPRTREPAPNTDADTDPQQWDEPGNPSTSIDLAVTAVEDVTPDTSRMVPITGGLRATLLASQTGPSQPQLHCGDLVELPLRLRMPERYRDPGVWQYADYLLADQGADDNIAVTASAPAAKLRIASGPSSRSVELRCRIARAQSWAAARILAYVRSTPNRRLPALLRLSPEDAGMVNAMLFGDRSRLTHTLRIGFERTGSFHLFVVSGMHVAVLAGLLFLLLRRIGLRDLIATASTLALVSAYAALTGFGVPVERALLMTAVFLIARLFSRERNSLNALGAAALVVLIATPRALFEASFQMTFLAIVAIAGIAMPLAGRSFLPYANAARNLRQLYRDAILPPRLAQLRVMLRLWSETLAHAFTPRIATAAVTLFRLPLYLAELILIGIIAEAVMILPMALVFHRATLFAVPANVVVVPLVGILAPLGFVTFLASLVSPYLAAIPASLLAMLLHAVTAAIQHISRIPSADLRVPGPTIAHALLACACFAIACWAVRRTRAWAVAGIAILALGAAFALWPSAPLIHPDQLEVSAIDVGQGDSLLIVSPSGRTMLIDAGGPTGAAANAENAAANATFDIGEQVVSPYLWSRRIRRLDIVALTHAHSDHMGGMPAVLRNFRPRELWVGIDPDSAAYRALLAEAATLNIRVRHLHAGDRVPWGGVDISVLSPAPEYANPGAPANNDSLVLRMQFGAASALLEGDAEAPSEHRMAADALAHIGPALGPDTLLKVGHHGSLTSTTPEFLAQIAPQDAVISVGRANTFGHPRAEVIARLHDAHARVFRTDQLGLATFLLSRDGRIAALPPASNP
jgi:competence protein ComEC